MFTESVVWEADPHFRSTTRLEARSERPLRLCSRSEYAISFEEAGVTEARQLRKRFGNVYPLTLLFSAPIAFTPPSFCPRQLSSFMIVFVEGLLLLLLLKFDYS